MLCRGVEKKGVVRAWHGRSMASVNQTRPHCVNQMGKTHSKPLAARNGRGTAWARHAMCESAFTEPSDAVNAEMSKQSEGRRLALSRQFPPSVSSLVSWLVGLLVVGWLVGYSILKANSIKFFHGFPQS